MYPSWCKRPCFHDEYLPSFNRRNVTLVNTEVKGVAKITETGVKFGGKVYDVYVPMKPYARPSVICFGRRGI